ncbi:MAG: TonB family protein [Balneolaceae bacterium]
MEVFISAAASYSEMVIETIWFPLTVWTLVTGLVLAGLKGFDKIHSQYHYHIRLALMAALPFGILTSYLIGMISASSETSYIIISMMSPIEVGVAEVEESDYSAFEILYSVFTLIFMSGMLYFSGRYLMQWAQLLSLKKRSIFYPIEKLTEIKTENLIQAQVSGKKILVGFSEDDIIPVTFGTLKPVILLPASLRKDPEKLNLALRHELTHIRQNDFSTHLWVTSIKTLFWFHPFVHLLAKQITDFREMRCDSLVLADNTVSKKEYASLLLELLPMPNLNKEISVNMAQESSNIKKRIQMMNQSYKTKTIPKRSSLAMLGVFLAATVLAMACTDMQTQNVFDEEELNLMTDPDLAGERGYHQVIIFMGEEGQDERHQEALEQLGRLEPEHISEIEVLKGEAAVEAYGDRATHGVILIKTKQDPESYNTVLGALGMEDQSLSPSENITRVDSQEDSEPEDYFVVVEDMPELIGGLSEIQQTIRYPEMARRAGIEGRVYVQFIVNENGDVERPRVIRGIGGGADEEAVRAVRQAKFKPGLQRGRPVRVQYSLPIFFRLAPTEASEEEKSSEDGISVVGYN